MTTVGLREKAKPSFGRNRLKSILLFIFSSWISAAAYVPGDICENAMVLDCAAGTRRFIADGSLPQSGNALGFLVRHTISWPFILRRPLTFKLTSTPLPNKAGAGAAATRLFVAKAAKTNIGAAHFIPKPKV